MLPRLGYAAKSLTNPINQAVNDEFASFPSPGPPAPSSHPKELRPSQRARSSQRAICEGAVDSGASPNGRSSSRAPYSSIRGFRLPPANYCPSGVYHQGLLAVFSRWAGGRTRSFECFVLGDTGMKVLRQCTVEEHSRSESSLDHFDREQGGETCRLVINFVAGHTQCSPPMHKLFSARVSRRCRFVRERR